MVTAPDTGPYAGLRRRRLAKTSPTGDCAVGSVLFDFDSADLPLLKLVTFFPETSTCTAVRVCDIDFPVSDLGKPGTYMSDFEQPWHGRPLPRV